MERSQTDVLKENREHLTILKNCDSVRGKWILSDLRLILKAFAEKGLEHLQLSGNMCYRYLEVNKMAEFHN